MPRFSAMDGVATSYRDPTALNHTFRSVSPYNAAAALSKRKCISCGVWVTLGRECSVCGTHNGGPAAAPHHRSTSASRQLASHQGPRGGAPLSGVDVNRVATKTVAMAMAAQQQQQQQQHQLQQQVQHAVSLSRPSSERDSDDGGGGGGGGGGFAEWLRQMETRERHGDVRDALLRKATANINTGSDSFVAAQHQATMTPESHLQSAAALKRHDMSTGATSTRAFYGGGRSTTPTVMARSNARLDSSAVAQQQQRPTTPKMLRPTERVDAATSFAAQPQPQPQPQPQQQQQQRSRSPWYARASQHSAAPVAPEVLATHLRSGSAQQQAPQEAHYGAVRAGYSSVVASRSVSAGEGLPMPSRNLLPSSYPYPESLQHQHQQQQQQAWHHQQQQQQEQQATFGSYLQLVATTRSASATSQQQQQQHAHAWSDRSASAHSSLASTVASASNVVQCRTCSAKLQRGHTCRVCMTVYSSPHRSSSAAAYLYH